MSQKNAHDDQNVQLPPGWSAAGCTMLGPTWYKRNWPFAVNTSEEAWRIHNEEVLSSVQKKLDEIAQRMNTLPKHIRERVISLLKTT